MLECSADEELVELLGVSTLILRGVDGRLTTMSADELEEDSEE
jgi:hypothetical protein